jgi:hypothetical protein
MHRQCTTFARNVKRRQYAYVGEPPKIDAARVDRLTPKCRRCQHSLGPKASYRVKFCNACRRLNASERQARWRAANPDKFAAQMAVIRNLRGGVTVSEYRTRIHAKMLDRGADVCRLRGQGLKFREIAQRLGMTANTALGLFHRTKAEART